MGKSTEGPNKEGLISFLSQLFESIGAPNKLLSDNGTNLTSKAFEKFLDKWKVRHLFTPPFRSQANGVVERVNRKINSALRTALLDNPTTKWSTLLKPVIEAMNEIPHKSTGFSPKFLHFGQSHDSHGIPVEEARALATSRSRVQQDQSKAQNDQKATLQEFTIGQVVRYHLPDGHPDRINKFAPRWWAPCVIIERLGSDSFLVEQQDVESGEMIRRFQCHSSRLMPYTSRHQKQPTEDTEPKNESNYDNNLSEDGQRSGRADVGFILSTSHSKN